MNTSSAGTRCRRTTPASRSQPVTSPPVAPEGSPARSPLGARVERLAASRLSRRSTLAATALGLLSPLLGDESQAAKRQADIVASAPPALPTGSAGNPYVLPPCGPGVEHYCIESATIDGVALPATNPDISLTATLINYATGGEVDQLAFMASAGRTPAGAAGLGKNIVARLRLGRFEPTVSFVYAVGFNMTVSGDASSGFVVDLQGQMTAVPYTNGNPEQAAWLDVYFGFNSFRPGSRYDGLFGKFGGYVAGASIAGIGQATWTGDGFFVMADSPHFLPDGSINRGAYRAWISPPTLQALQITPAEAVAGGLVATRTDGGVTNSLSATLTERDGGVLIDIPDLTFSSPKIAVTRRASGGCDPKCKKGRVCKNGRCVKKKKNKKKHK